MFRVVPLAKLVFEYEVDESARKLWELLVQKVGKPKAKDIMRRIMGDEKPGPKKPLEGLLSSIIQGCISKNARESDEKIAKRILARKLCYVQYQSGDFGIAESDKLDRGDLLNVEDGVVDIIVEWNPIGKGLAGLKKRVERIRGQMIEDGELPKAFSRKKYYPRGRSGSGSR